VILLKLAALLVLVGGAMVLLRPRVGLLIGLALVPVLILSAVGTMFMAAAYLIFLSVVICTMLLLYIVIKGLMN
jgi:hypothetical protein